MDVYSLIARRNLLGRQTELKLSIAAFLTLTSLVLPGVSWAETLSLSASTNYATAGYYQLSWPKSDKPISFQLQESRSEDFSDARTVYQGSDTASVISGRSDGQYLYRLRRLDNDKQTASDWSEPVRVTVKHHPLERAAGFFFVGFIVFIATLLAILSGSKKTTR